MTKANGPLFNVHFRRRKQGRTNYAKRLGLLKSGQARLVIRKTNTTVIVQLIAYRAKGDTTICQANSNDLKEFGFNPKRNVPTAYLLGMLTAKRALAKGVNQGIADFGLHTASKGGILFAAVKGAIDGGLNITVGEEKLPKPEHLAGKHLGIAADVSQTLDKIKQAKV